MVESVAWITERKNVLSLALELGSLIAYLRFARSERVCRRNLIGTGRLALVCLIVCAIRSARY